MEQVSERFEAEELNDRFDDVEDVIAEALETGMGYLGISVGIDG
jgi:hypothetical protein